MVGRQAGELEGADDAPDVQRRGVGEDVALGERPRLGVAVAHAGDAVVEQAALGLQQVAQALGVRVDLDVADVLDHADRGDRVEALPEQLAPVLDADVDAVGDAGLLGARAGALGLRRRTA